MPLVGDPCWNIANNVWYGKQERLSYQKVSSDLKVLYKSVIIIIVIIKSLRF